MSLYVLVFAICVMPGKHCVVSVHSVYEHWHGCKLARDGQNALWEAQDYKSRVECITTRDVKITGAKK